MLKCMVSLIGNNFSLPISSKRSQNVFRGRIFFRSINSDSGVKFKHHEEKESKELVISSRELLQREFPQHFSDGKFNHVKSYVDFIDEALARLKDLGLERDVEAYKELLKIFPPGKYLPRPGLSFGLFHAPQQLCAIRLLSQMELNLVKVDREFEDIVVERFGISSDVWFKVARANFWTMKGRNLDPYPLPATIPKEAHKLAKIALRRMLRFGDSVISVTNTSSVPDSTDKTWVVHSQSPLQKSIIERLSPNSILYIENSGSTYVDNQSLTYFTLRKYLDENHLKKVKQREMQIEEPDYNYDTIKMKFFGKPIKEKLELVEETITADDYQILAIGITGTSSHDSVLSWLKILELRNPSLSKMNVVFKLDRGTYDLERVEETGPVDG